MNRAVVCAFCFLSFVASALCDEDVPSDTPKNLKDESFVVETDETSVSDSLNRISGKIDLGFATPEQTYTSEDHYRAGPFGRAEQQDKSQSY